MFHDFPINVSYTKKKKKDFLHLHKNKKKYIM